MKIRAIYDLGEKHLDRFTVYYREYNANGYYTARAMSEHPFRPDGFGQMTSGMMGKHNGKRVTFDDLPIDCQKLVKMDLGE